MEMSLWLRSRMDIVRFLDSKIKILRFLYWTRSNWKGFGELTVLEYIGKKRGPGKYNTESRFLCRCSCGNTIEVSYSHLSSGHTCTCGCGRSSYGELKIRELLIKNKLSFVPEFSPPELIGVNGGALRFDFALINNDKKVTRLIEFDGP